jgi:hypothetical protein
MKYGRALDMDKKGNPTAGLPQVLKRKILDLF